MPRATFAVDLRGESWIGDVSTSHPAAEFRLLTRAPLVDSSEAGVLAVTGVSATDLDAVVSSLRSSDAVTRVAVVHDGRDQRLVSVEATEPTIRGVHPDVLAALDPPVTVRDGSASVAVTAPDGRLSALASSLRGAGYAVAVESVHRRVDDATVLTDRQTVVVERAVEAGYYDTPRACSLSELAADLDRAKSSLSETLHRAESNLAKRHVADEDALAALGVGADDDPA